MAEAALKAADARVEMAMNELDNILIILAPFDGFIEEVYVEIGTLIGPSLPVCKNNSIRSNEGYW